MNQPLGYAFECGSHLADVQRRVQVAVVNVQVALLGLVAARDLADQEKIVLADVGCKLFDRAAEIPRLFQRDVLERVNSNDMINSSIRLKQNETDPAIAQDGSGCAIDSTES